MKYSMDHIPYTDILGNELHIGDTVTVFSSHGITYANCRIVEKDFTPYEETQWIRRAIEIDDSMWFFGLGNHEIIKVV